MSNIKGDSNSRLPELNRREFLAAGGVGAASLYLANAASARAARELLRPAAVKTVTGVPLPANAAPLSQQFLVGYSNPTGATYKCFDFYESVYSRAPLADNFSTSLVRINSNFQIVPGTAKTWKQTSPTTWEFYITPGIMWTDGNELTANDYVETLRYSADPKHAWDFTWYWTTIGIKNYAAAVAGKVPLSAVGVSVGKDKYTFVVTTEAPVAFIPMAMLYSMPLSAAGLNKYGNGLYNTNPATSISMGPYVLKSFNPTSSVVLAPNTKYNLGYGSPIQYQIAKITSADYLPLLETGAVDTGPNLSKTQLQIAKATPRLSKLTPYLNPQDFRVHYIFFKTKAAPFNNVKVRQAFAHAVDRDSIINALIAPLAIPAYGYLAPGFPFAINDPLKKYTNYDPATAQRLLAQAGYPNGKGFPEVTFSYPAQLGSLDVVTTGLVAQALAANLNKVLFNGGSTILLQELDNATFYKKMQAKPTEIDMGLVSYGQDYFDASNMLGVYAGGGRHDWNDAQYDHLLAQGAVIADHSKRQEIYTEAQTRLTSQAPAVFLFFGLYAYLMYPYVQGPALARNSLGYNGIEWPGFFPFSSNQQGIYIGNNVGQYPRQDESSMLK